MYYRALVDKKKPNFMIWIENTVFLFNPTFIEEW